MSIRGELLRHASALPLQQGQPRFGTVSSVDTATMTAKVTLQPDGVLTNWLPIMCPAIGMGWGVIFPPNVGDQVLVVPHDGDPDNLVIIGAVFSQQQVPPNGSNPGEFWLVHQTGSFIKVTMDGNVSINSPQMINVTATSQINLTAPTVTVTASTEVQMVTPLLTVTGNIIDNSGSNTDNLSSMRTIFNEHTHTQPADSAGDTEKPTNTPLPQMT
jgi:phage baseplate assembly protein V